MCGHDAVHVSRFESFVSRFCRKCSVRRVCFLCVISFFCCCHFPCIFSFHIFNRTLHFVCHWNLCLNFSIVVCSFFSICYSIEWSAVPALLGLLAIGVFDTIDANGKNELHISDFSSGANVVICSLLWWCSRCTCIETTPKLLCWFIVHADCAVFFSHTIWSDLAIFRRGGGDVFAQRRGERKK